MEATMEKTQGASSISNEDFIRQYYSEDRKDAIIVIKPIVKNHYRVNFFKPSGDLVITHHIVKSVFVEVTDTPDGKVIIDHTK